MAVMCVDVGGTHVKFLAEGEQQARQFDSGPWLGPQAMVDQVLRQCSDWHFGAITLGYPGRVGHRGPIGDPGNLAPGWVNFDFAKAFGCPVKVINDAAMQALGSYEGGRMLFIGLGTGFGSALISEKSIVPLELGRLPYREDDLGETFGNAGREKYGDDVWLRLLSDVVPFLKEAFVADYVMLGGGNSARLRELPSGVRRGQNPNAFLGGYRLWEAAVAPTQHTDDRPVEMPSPPEEWRQV